MNKFLLFLFSYFLIITSAYADNQNNYYRNYFESCGAKNVELSSLKEDVFIFSFLNIDLKCLEKKFLSHLKKFPVESFASNSPVKFNENIIRSNKKYNENIKYAIIKITSLFSQKCGESCTFADELILKQGNNYWYVRGTNDKGVNAKMISDNVINLQNLMSTHKRNYIFNVKEKKINFLPNGDLQFKKDHILVKSQKSYFNEGGAFWFDSKINYSGEIIELTNDGNYCEKKNSFNNNIQNAMDRQNLKKLCVIVY